jgi:large subunit ribosomal protein L21
MAILPPSGAGGTRARFVFHEVVGTMFAVIKTGGKQYRVAENDVIRVEKLAGDAGDAVQFDNVLMIGDKVGAPLVDGAVVSGEVLGQDRDDKIVILKKKRRKNHRRKAGHRQDVTVVRITGLSADGKPAKKKAAPKKAKKTEAEAAPAEEAPAVEADSKE